jgi:hypothetical protein
MAPRCVTPALPLAVVRFGGDWLGQIRSWFQLVSNKILGNMLNGASHEAFVNPLQR